MRLELYKDLSLYQPHLLIQNPSGILNTDTRRMIFSDEICEKIVNNGWNSDN